MSGCLHCGGALPSAEEIRQRLVRACEDSRAARERFMQHAITERLYAETAGVENRVRQATAALAGFCSDAHQQMHSQEQHAA
jgi:hypothetical protein